MPLPAPDRKTDAPVRPLGARALILLLLVAIALTGCSDDTGSQQSQQSGESQEQGTSQDASAPCRLRPSASNTGASGTLRDDPLTLIEEDDVTLEDARIASLEIRGDDVTLHNVEVAGNIFVTGDDATVDHVTTTGLAISSASGTTVQYTDIGDSQGDGIHITTDGGSRSRDVTLRYNFIHSPEVPPEAHYDGTQVRGVDGLLVKCSTYDAGSYQSSYNAAIYLENANGGDSNVAIEHNWLLGWGFSVMLDAPGTRIVGNTLGGDTHWGSCYLGVGTSVESLDIRDNVDAESGKTNPVCVEAATSPGG